MAEKNTKKDENGEASRKLRKRNPKMTNEQISIPTRNPSKRAAKEKANEVMKEIYIEQEKDEIFAKAEEEYIKKKSHVNDNESKETSIKKIAKKRILKSKSARFFAMLDKVTTPEAERVLADMTERDLIATYEDCKTSLDKMWEEYILKPPNYIPLKDSLWAINTTTEESHLAMLNHLYDIYEMPLGNELPRHTDFLLQIMMPEWVTVIIMKRFNQTRAEVLKVHKEPYD